MTNQTILEKALLKAHKNGWTPVMADWRNVEVEQWQGNGLVGIALLYSDKGSNVHWMRELEGIIFNHDFAKSLWPSKDVVPFMNRDREIFKRYEWQHHLMEMVIAKNPIEYLGKNI